MHSSKTEKENCKDKTIWYLVLTFQLILPTLLCLICYRNLRIWKMNVHLHRIFKLCSFFPVRKTLLSITVWLIIAYRLHFVIHRNKELLHLNLLHVLRWNIRTEIGTSLWEDVVLTSLIYMNTSTKWLPVSPCNEVLLH